MSDSQLPPDSMVAWCVRSTGGAVYVFSVCCVPVVARLELGSLVNLGSQVERQHAQVVSHYKRVDLQVRVVQLHIEGVQ